MSVEYPKKGYERYQEVGKQMVKIRKLLWDCPLPQLDDTLRGIVSQWEYLQLELDETSRLHDIYQKAYMAITFLDGEDPYTKKDRAQEE